MIQALYLEPSDPIEATRTRQVLADLGYKVFSAHTSSELETLMRLPTHRENSIILVYDEHSGLRTSLVKSRLEGLLDNTKKVVIISKNNSNIYMRSWSYLLNRQYPSEKILILTPNYEPQTLKEILPLDDQAVS